VAEKLDAKILEWWKLLVGIVVALVGAGATATAYLDRLASADDLRSVDARVTSLEQAQRDMRDDVRWLRDQIANIADSVGAQRVPPRKDR
jgi:hypothetical protein